jgi:hypothetical protein
MDVVSGVRLGTALLAAGALAACGGSSPSPQASPTPAASSAAPSASASPSSDTRFFESFDNNDNDWPTRTDPDGTKLAVTDGEYQVTLPAGSIRYIRPAALASRDDVRTGVSVTGKVQALGGKTYAFGLACRMSPSDKQYYVGRLFQDGTSALIRREKGKGEVILKASRANPIDLSESRPVQLVIFCGEKEGKMDLTLTVNGEVAVQAEDATPLPPNPPGIYTVAGLDSPTSTFAYDDILVSPFTPE